MTNKEISLNVQQFENEERRTVALESIATSLHTLLDLIQGVTPAEMKRRGNKHRQKRAKLKQEKTKAQKAKEGKKNEQ